MNWMYLSIAFGLIIGYWIWRLRKIESTLQKYQQKTANYRKVIYSERVIFLTSPDEKIRELAKEAITEESWNQ